MPLLAGFKRAAHAYFDLAAQRRVAASQPLRSLEPILSGRQELARASPQPDRLVAVCAAASPLFEAARPLLKALATMPARLDLAQAEALHRQLVAEVPSFQAVCGDARIRPEYIVGASYALCAALDESASAAFVSEADSRAEETNPWMTRSLAVRFHGNSKGGAQVFTLVGRLVIEPKAHIDLLEVVFVIFMFGFEGAYRYAANGRRELDNMRHQIHAMVSNCRKSGNAEQLAHWQRVERSIDKVSAARPQGDLSP